MFAIGVFLPALLAGVWFFGARGVSSAYYSGGQFGHLEHYVHYLHEFSVRRRVNTYFSNYQSVFYGVPVNFVNVGRGNLSFLRRDLVTTGRIPLVVARVYDSAGEGSHDFGQGWHLTAAERIEVESGVATLFTEAGATIRFATAGDSFVRSVEFPSDYSALRRGPSGSLIVTMADGWTREFRLIGNSYRLTRVADRSGNELRLTYAGTTLARIANDVRSVQFVRDRRGRIVEARDDLGRSVRYGYDDRGFLVSVTDLGGHTWTYRYADAGGLHKAADPQGVENLKVWYESRGRVRRIELPSGRIAYSYDEFSRVTTVQNRRNLVSRYFQNHEGITTCIINSMGEETSLVLDEARNIREVRENGVLKHVMEYDGEHRVVRRRSYADDGRISVRYHYDSPLRQLSRIEYSDGRLLEIGYDPLGYPVQVSDGGTEKRYTYSAQGELLWLHENPPAREYSFEYSIAGLISRLFEGGTATDLQYDPHGNVVGVYFSDGVAVRMEYDVLGLRRKLEFSDGRRFEYSYDPAGNLVGIELIRWDGFRDGQTLELDSDYQVRRQHLADGRIVELQYDRNGNLIEKRFGSSVTRFEYDELDRLTAVVEPDGRRLTYRYAPGEPSLITQLDSETGPISLDRRDRGLTFATQGEISWTRSQPAMYGTVTFAEALGRFQLAGIGGEEIAVAALNAVAAVRKLRLVDASRLLAERPREFLAPSNLFFLPREYATINCCPICPFDPSEPQCDPCYMDPPPPDPEPTPSVTIQGLDNVPLRAAGSTATNFITLTAEGTPSGGSYAWSTTSTRVTLTANNHIATVRSQSQSNAIADVPIQVTYTQGSQSAIAIKYITVSKPTSLFLESDTTNPTGTSCNVLCVDGSPGCPPYSSYRRIRWYVVRDQFNRLFTNMGITSVQATESFTGWSSTCGHPSPATGSPTTSRFGDEFALCDQQCRQGGTGCTNSATQSITVNGFSVRTSNITWTCSQVTIIP